MEVIGHDDEFVKLKAVLIAVPKKSFDK